MNFCEIVESKYKNNMQYVTRMLHKNVFASALPPLAFKDFSHQEHLIGTLNEGLALCSDSSKAAPLNSQKAWLKVPEAFGQGEQLRSDTDQMSRVTHLLSEDPLHCFSLLSEF